MTLYSLLRPRKLEALYPDRFERIREVRTRRQGAPWFLQAALGFGLLCATTFACAGVLVLLPAPQVFGFLLAAGASVASWMPLPWWTRPGVLGAIFLARPMLWTLWSEPQGEIGVGIELALFFAHRDPVNRTFAACSLLGWMAFAWPEGTRLWVLLALTGAGAALAVRRLVLDLTFVRELLWYGALGGLIFALMGPAVPGPAYGAWFPLVVGAALAAIGGAVASKIASSWVDIAAAVLFPLALAALTVPVPGVLVALVVAMLGFLVRSPALWGAAVLAFTTYGAWFMYELTWDLWAKGGAMVGTGLVLVLLGWLAGRRR